MKSSELLSLSEEYSEGVSDVIEAKYVAELLGAYFLPFTKLLPKEANYTVVILLVEALTSIAKTSA